MLRISLFLCFVLSSVSGHDEYRGKCPDLKPMDNFDWDKVKIETRLWSQMSKNPF